MPSMKMAKGFSVFSLPRMRSSSWSDDSAASPNFPNSAILQPNRESYLMHDITRNAEFLRKS